MADRVWVSINGDAGSTASWLGGALPVSGDRVIFEPGMSQVGPRLNLDFGATGVNLAELFIAPKFEFPIGTAGSPWKSESSVIRHYGNAPLYYQTKNAGVELDTVDTYIDSPCKGEAAVFTGGGSSLFVNVVIARGHVEFAGGIVPFKASVGLPGPHRGDGVASMTINSTQSHTAERIDLFAGIVKTTITIPAIGSKWGIFGGTWVHSGGAMWEAHLAGGSLIYNAPDDANRIVQSGGILDTSRTSHARTFATVVQFGGDFIKSSQTTVSAHKDLRIQRRSK